MTPDLTSTFSEHQVRVFDAFHIKDTDINIAVLYYRVYGDPGRLTIRDMQQKLAPTFDAMNKKWFNGWKIVPGETKQTYRLATDRG